MDPQISRQRFCNKMYLLPGLLKQILQSNWNCLTTVSAAGYRSNRPWLGEQNGGHVNNFLFFFLAKTCCAINREWPLSKPGKVVCFRVGGNGTVMIRLRYGIKCECFLKNYGYDTTDYCFPLIRKRLYTYPCDVVL